VATLNCFTELPVKDSYAASNNNGREETAAAAAGGGVRMH